MACECVEVVNKKLAEHNTQIMLPILVMGGGATRVMIETMKLDEKKRGKPVTMFATYCPFCGLRYEPEEPVT